ncbi:outer membrane protein assembly factor BamC [Hydrogenophaga aquatica]
MHTSTLRHAVPRWSALAMAALLATGCSVLQEDKIDYKSAKQVNTLEVPPDLTQLSRESRYVVPGGAVTASGYQVSQPTQKVATAAVSVGDVRIERAGNQRWLVVDRPADQLWSPVRDFWQENGFLLTLDQENLGVMETDWAENRAKLPQDIIRSTIGKVFDSLYSTGERDKFRTRLERTANGGTEIYISHRGMVEVYSSERKDSTVWQPRPADVELEAEFLRRMMVKLGVSQEQSKALLATGATTSTSKVATVNNQPVVQINEGFDRAWRRVGLALDRTGFTVEDRDRAQGVYFVRYVEANANTAAEKPGFFSRLFGSSTAKESSPVRYRISVKSAGEQTTVAVLNANGQPETSATAQRIVQVIADDLK